MSNKKSLRQIRYNQIVSAWTSFYKKEHRTRKELQNLISDWTRFYGDDRDLLAYILNINGYTYRDIEKLLQIPAENVSGYVNAALKRIENGELNTTKEVINK